MRLLSMNWNCNVTGNVSATTSGSNFEATLTAIGTPLSPTASCSFGVFLCYNGGPVSQVVVYSGTGATPIEAGAGCWLAYVSQSGAGLGMVMNETSVNESVTVPLPTNGSYTFVLGYGIVTENGIVPQYSTTYVATVTSSTPPSPSPSPTSGFGWMWPLVIGGVAVAVLAAGLAVHIHRRR